MWFGTRQKTVMPCSEKGDSRSGVVLFGYSTCRLDGRSRTSHLTITVFWGYSPVSLFVDHWLLVSVVYRTSCHRCWLTSSTPSKYKSVVCSFKRRRLARSKRYLSFLSHQKFRYFRLCCWIFNILLVAKICSPMFRKNGILFNFMKFVY